MGSHRSDFARNERAIIEAATRVLSDAPAAGMGEIAAAAGLGRATLYRHFPTREALTEGLRREAFDAIGAVIERCAALPVAGRLARVAGELVEVGARYRIVFAAPLDAAHAREVRERFDVPMAAYVEAAKAAGELDRELPADWLLIVLGGAIGGALRAIAEERLTVAQARTLVQRTLFDGFRPPPPPPPAG